MNALNLLGALVKCRCSYRMVSFALGLVPVVMAEAQAAEPMQVKTAELPDEVSKSTACLNPQYLVATPAGDTGSDDLPLLIFLHGGGGSGADIERHRSAFPIKFYNGQRKQHFVIVVPQCMKGNSRERPVWRPRDLDLLFAHLKETVLFDQNRVYLTGYSMGGYGTWAWASASPQHFAAIAPMAGGLGIRGPKDVTPDLDNWVQQLKSLPISIYHGAKDKVVPAERSERMFKALKTNGAQDVALKLLPDKGHNIGGIYSDNGLYQWMLKHSRSSGSDVPSEASCSPTRTAKRRSAIHRAPASCTGFSRPAREST